MIDNQLHDCEVCAENNVRKTITTPVGHIPTPERPFRHQGPHVQRWRTHKNMAYVLFHAHVQMYET